MISSIGTYEETGTSRHRSSPTRSPPPRRRHRACRIAVNLAIFKLFACRAAPAVREASQSLRQVSRASLVSRSRRQCRERRWRRWRRVLPSSALLFGRGCTRRALDWVRKCRPRICPYITSICRVRSRDRSSVRSLLSFLRLFL